MHSLQPTCMYLYGPYRCLDFTFPTLRRTYLVDVLFSRLDRTTRALYVVRDDTICEAYIDAYRLGLGDHASFVQSREMRATAYMGRWK